MIVGMMSTFCEGQLARSACESLLRACDKVVVFEGPVGGAEEVSGLWTQLPDTGKFVVEYGEWASDAAKRQAMVEYVKHRWGGVSPLWGVWLDGDELLLWGEYLRDWLGRLDAENELTRTQRISLPSEAESGGDFIVPEPTFNWLIRLVELDASVAKCSGKVVRLDLIDEYLVSSYQVRLMNGAIVALPNVPAERGPIPGEPHILHRSGLRDPRRQIRRLHDAEADWFTEQELVKALAGKGII